MRILLSLIAALITAPVFAQEVPKAETVYPSITVSTVSTQKLRDVIVASGLVGAVEQVAVVPMVQGQQVAELLADVGDTVTAGQVIARLSSSAFSLQKSELDSALAAAKTANDATLVANLTEQLDAASKSLARAELTIARTDVKAAVAGEITARNAQLGALPQGPMFTIMRDGLLELRADVSESDLVKLQVGQTAALTIVGTSAPIKGTVRLVEPTIDPVTRLGRVRISVDDSKAVRAGMFVEAAILVAERDALAVPVTAVGAFDGKSTVMAIKDNIAGRKDVVTGIRMGGWIEITSGLSAGETVVTKAGAFVRQGDKINPVPAVSN
jgi:HlyD family secretion protein